MVRRFFIPYYIYGWGAYFVSKERDIFREKLFSSIGKRVSVLWKSENNRKITSLIFTSFRLKLVRKFKALRHRDLYREVA